MCLAVSAELVGHREIVGTSRFCRVAVRWRGWREMGSDGGHVYPMCTAHPQSTPTSPVGSSLVLAQGALAPDNRARLERVAARSSRAESGGAPSSHGAPQASGRPGNCLPTARGFSA